MPEVKPTDILFGVPTLHDPLPPSDQGDASAAGACWLHEDTWRQIEFIGGSQVDDVERELVPLRAFIRDHRKGAGWTKVHVRVERPEGLQPMRIDGSALKSLVPTAAPWRPLTLGTPPWGPYRVAGGFGVDIGPDLVLYGHAVGNHLVSLAVAAPDGGLPARVASPTLAEVASRLSLRLIDWPAATWVMVV